MRLLLLTPGTGHFYCGSCLRDNVLARALSARGHDVSLAPLYLPFWLEEGGVDQVDLGENAALHASEARGSTFVHMGGINVFLAEKAPALAKHLPGWMAERLDSPGLLRWASRRGDMTDAAALGTMTVSMLHGREGRQEHEVAKLVEWAQGAGPFDAVVLSNALLLGLVPALREGLARPILCTLQGEAPFLDELAEPHRTQAWSLAAERARSVERFIAVSHYTADLMAERWDLPRERIAVVPNGIDVEDFTPLAEEQVNGRATPTLAYLARLTADKGFGTLVDAFLDLARRPGLETLELDAAGVELGADRSYVQAQRRKLEQAGLSARARIRSNVDRATKIELLRSATVFSVPATYGESFGLYVLEALACGVPVVQPRHGAFPEIVEATGGGRLCEPNDPHSLAEELAQLLGAPDEARALGRQGRAAVLRDFTSEQMARGVEDVCRMAARSLARETPG